MKYLKIPLFAVIITMVFLLSCNKDAQNFTNSPKSAFQINDINGKPVEYLAPSLLKAVHSNLIENNRAADAKTLYEQYDSNTGLLKGSTTAIPEQAKSVEKIDSSKMALNRDTIKISHLKAATDLWEPNAVVADGHVEGVGDQGKNARQSSVIPSGSEGEYIGTVGANRRLESIIINLQPEFMLNPNERPVLNYSLKNGYNQWFSGKWGSWVGIKGNSLANYYVRMWFDYGYSNYHIFYVSHHEGRGWLTIWYYDNQTCGYSSRMEAIAYKILKY